MKNHCNFVVVLIVYNRLYEGIGYSWQSAKQFIFAENADMKLRAGWENVQVVINGILF